MSFNDQMNMNNMMNQMTMNNNNMMNQMAMNNMMNQMNPNMMNQMNNNMMNQMNQNFMMNMLMNQMNNQMQNLSNNAQEFQNQQQQNNENFNNNQTNPQQNQDDGTRLEITFIKNNQNEAQRSIKIFCLNSEKVGDIIQKYRVKADDNNKEEKFIYNAKKLNPDLTVAEAGLINQSKIFVMVTENIVGGGKINLI